MIFVPGSVLKANPAMWLQVITKQRGKALGKPENIAFYQCFVMFHSMGKL